MTKCDLIRLRSLLQETERIEGEIEALHASMRKNSASDAVSGSSAEFPYTRKVFAVSGPRDEAQQRHLFTVAKRRAQKLRKRRLECQQEYERITADIEAVEDGQLREALLLHFREGLSWEETAARLGGGNTADSVRMMVNRYLKKEEHK